MHIDRAKCLKIVISPLISALTRPARRVYISRRVNLIKYYKDPIHNPGNLSRRGIVAENCWANLHCRSRTSQRASRGEASSVISNYLFVLRTSRRKQRQEPTICSLSCIRDLSSVDSSLSKTSKCRCGCHKKFGSGLSRAESAELKGQS